MRSILVLLRPKAQTRGLDGKLSYVCGGRRVEFEYDLIRLWKEPVNLFLGGGLALLPLAPLCKLPRGKTLTASLREVVREIDRRLAQEIEHAQAIRLMTAMGKSCFGAFVQTGMRVANHSLADICDGVKIMPESNEGRIAGRIEGMLKAMLEIGRKQFGPPNSKTESALTAIRDVERLKRMLDAMRTAKSWKELLAIQ